ncbi:aerobic respiration two-component sensor histidine kinase ArcB [Aliagarivorans marinus]|uniref:aerobic respiration two-component sensor histidine kinase ArcB n=1 Tax=Aliagarivorans marinus TaxID=561965 RepID=UPI00041F55D8|nr:aerobic respiration two-component sensor histidine kinase ArcB [Aliagarivorans marinus]
MHPFKKLATYYVFLLSRLGVVRFSATLAVLIILVALTIQVSVTFALTGDVSSVDLVRSVFFGLIITPWAVFFMSVIVEQLEESRQRLTGMIRKLEQMRAKDLQMTNRLQANIDQLNREIEERERAESERSQAIFKLEREVKQRQIAQAESDERYALLRSFIDSSPDLVYYRNEEGRFYGCNRAHEELTGHSEKELIGLTPYDVYPDEVAQRIIETDRQVFESDDLVTYEQWLEYPDGRKAYFELRKVPFYAHTGKRLGLLGFGRDITERMQHQASVEKANRDKTQFISTLSHELRTPLNGVVGLSQMLLDTPLDKEQRKQVNTILLSATSLGNIFNDIIDLDKLDRRRFAVALAPMDFQALLTDIETLTRLQVASKSLAFSMEQHGPVPTVINGDATRLRQVLWNLCHNAVKFTESGKIEVVVRAFESEHDNCVDLRIEVHDTGPGIPEEEQEQIFAMYYQAKGSKQATGTGIGLAISRQLVQAMGGDLEVESEPGKGSCFTISLEVELDSLPEQAEQIEHPPLEILLVEDVELNVTIAKALLEKLGHTVAVAMTGTEALDNFNPDDFDLYLLDIQLPDMTGFDVAKRLRERFPASHLPPLVALTANVIRDRADFDDAGIIDIVNKPINYNAMVGCLNKIFYIGEQEQQPERQAAAKKLPSHVVLSRSSKPVLDYDLIAQFVENLGPEIFIDSVELFAEVMPGYLKILESNLTAQDQEGIASEAHKIKGAAGSVGLARLQRLANKIQSPELPAWEDNVEDWIHQLVHDFPGDLELLREEVARLDQAKPE